MKRVKNTDLINSKFLYLLTHIKYRSLNNISYLHLGSGHYLWGVGRGGGGLANGETERLELFVPPSTMKDNLFCPPPSPAARTCQRF